MCHMQSIIHPMFKKIIICDFSAINFQFERETIVMHICWINLKNFPTNNIDNIRQWIQCQNDLPPHYRLWHLWLDCGVTLKCCCGRFGREKREWERKGRGKENTRKWERSAGRYRLTDEERRLIERGTDKYGWRANFYPIRDALVVRILHEYLFGNQASGRNSD